MIARPLRTALLLLLVFAAGAEYHTAVEMRGRVTTWIDVRIADKPAEQGVAEVTLVVTVEGPLGLVVDKVEITDAVSGWKMTESPPQTRREGDAVLWTNTVVLKKAKTGTYVPLPAVKVRFREGPDAAAETVEWPDLLRQPHVTLTPVELPEPPSTARQWRGRAAVALVVANLLLIGGLVWRRRGERRPRLTPEQRAAAEIAAGVQLLALDAAAAHERMAAAVRAFLGERYHLPATHQTTAEFLAAAGRDAPEALREFLERCDLVKFAGVWPSADEGQRTVEMAYQLISIGRDPKGKAEEAAPAGRR